MAIDPLALSPKNPLVYNPLTLGIPVLASVFGKKGDPNNSAAKTAAWSGSNLPDFSGGNVVPPPTGETPIAELPKWGNSQGERTKYYAALDFSQMFGRNPTASELAMLAPAYVGDTNIDNRPAGQAQLASYFQSLANTPANQQAALQKQYEANAPKYYDQINGMFKNTLGRDATDAEKSHFGSLMASGNVDAYTVGQFLTALPESVQKQDAAFRQTLGGDLQKQDAQYYQEQILPVLQAQASKQGRSLDSSGVNNSLALAAQQQNRQRESFLTGLTAQQYQNQQGLAQDAYLNSYGNYQGLQNYSLQRSNQLQDAVTNRMNELQNFTLQKNAYDEYLQRYGKRSGISGAFGGAGSGAMIGSAFGPWGTAIGGVAGGLAGYFGSQGGNY